MKKDKVKKILNDLNQAVFERSIWDKFTNTGNDHDNLMQRNPSAITLIEEESPRLLVAAKREFDARRYRDGSFSESIFGEPAWDILLDLFINRIQGKRVSVKAACIAASVPMTTALRWVRHMENLGMIKRTDSLSDKRRAWLQISDKAFAQVADYLRKREFI